jgi:hypothetical protein
MSARIKVTVSGFEGSDRIYQTPFMSKGELRSAIAFTGSDIITKGSGTSTIAISPSKKTNQDYLLSPQEGEKIAAKIKEVWLKEARALLTGTALHDYERAIRVSSERGKIFVGLEGWEAVSSDQGWRPDPGGLIAGIGKYDGTIYDMKPMLLKGAQRRVIPMRLTGTRGEIKNKIFQHFEEGAIAPLDGTTSKPAVKSKIGSLTHAAFGLEQGSRLKLGNRNGSFGDEDDDDEGGGRPIPSALQRAGFGPGKAREGYTRLGANRPGRRFTKSIIEGATRAGDLPSPVKNSARGPQTANFIIFRTVTDGSVKFKESKGGKLTKKQRKALKSAEAMRHKWLTAGRKGIKLMAKISDLAAEIVADIMSKKINGTVTSAYVSRMLRASTANFSRGQAMAAMAAKPKRGSRGVR